MDGGGVVCVFFFQAEDGIRDDLVTGVQTCALPICCSWEYLTKVEPKYDRIFDPDIVCGVRSKVNALRIFHHKEGEVPKGLVREYINIFALSYMHTWIKVVSLILCSYKSLARPE